MRVEGTATAYTAERSVAENGGTVLTVLLDWRGRRENSRRREPSCSSGLELGARRVAGGFEPSAWVVLGAERRGVGGALRPRRLGRL